MGYDMEDIEWQEIREFIKKKLVEFDREEIFDLVRNDGSTSAEENVNSMLDALKEELKKEDKVVRKSLDQLKEYIDLENGVYPKKVVVWPEEGPCIELNNESAITELEKITNQFFLDRDEPGLTL